MAAAEPDERRTTSNLTQLGLISRSRGTRSARRPRPSPRRSSDARPGSGTAWWFPSSFVGSSAGIAHRGCSPVPAPGTRFRSDDGYFPRRSGRDGPLAWRQCPFSLLPRLRSFATQILRAGYDMRSVQKLMGHNDIRKTMIYVQAATDAGLGIRSPLDRPWL